jgi:hypothetical protein
LRQNAKPNGRLPASVQWETSDHFSERINRRQKSKAVCAQNFL